VQVYKVVLLVGDTHLATSEAQSSPGISTKLNIIKLKTDYFQL